MSMYMYFMIQVVISGMVHGCLCKTSKATYNIPEHSWMFELKTSLYKIIETNQPKLPRVESQTLWIFTVCFLNYYHSLHYTHY